MSVVAATWLVWLCGIYGLAGLLFAIYFVPYGVNRIDPDARQGSWGFRLLIVPGAVLLWPLLLRRIAAGQSMPPEEHNAHRRAAQQRHDHAGGSGA